jgi:hypothetical protein
MRRLSVALTAVIVSLFLSSGTALATDPTLWGWLTARKPTTANYTPGALDQGNANGYMDSVARYYAGHYEAKFPQIQNPNRVGAAIVTALSTSPRLCVMSDIGSPSTPDEINVDPNCYGPGGGQRDSEFSVIFTTGGVDSGALAYVWANQAGSPSYTPDPNYQFDRSSATPITITRPGLGTYKVTLPGISGGVGNIQVAAVEDAFCRIVSWLLATPTVVTVKCFSPFTDTASDTQFELAYTNGVGLSGVAGQSAAYLFANKPTTASYTPGAAFSYTTGMPMTVKHNGTGAYSISLPGMLARGAAAVTAAGSGSKSRCQLGTIGITTPMKVSVLCFSPTGAPLNSKFTFSYTNHPT